MLNAKTIRSGPNLGNISAAIRRPDYRQSATEITTVHIDGTEAVVSTGTMGLWNAFSEQFRIANCRDAAIAYDGSWALVYNEKGEQVYTFYTIGEPYIAYVTNDNKLYVQQGNSLPTYVTSGYITSVSCIRGWQNIKDTTQNQGLVVAYVKEGVACYRNYSKHNDTLMWGNESKIPIDNVQSINVTRSIDFRVIFNVTTKDGRGHIFFSERCFSGLSINNEHIQGHMSVNSVKANRIETEIINIDKEYIRNSMSVLNVTAKPVEPIQISFNEYINANMSVTNNTKALQAATKFNYFKIKNVSDTVIEILSDVEICYNSLNELRQGLLITDTNGYYVFIESVTYDYGLMTLTVLPMNDLVEGDLTISYDNSVGTVLNQSGESLDSFSYNFTPTNLVNIGTADTKITSIENISENTIVITYDNNIMESPDTKTLINAFEINAIEEEWVNGPQFDVTYEIESVEKTGDNELTLTTKNRFNNALNGCLTIKYHNNLGNLLDANNTRVKSSTTSIELSNVIRKPNPHVSEYIINNSSITKVTITPLGTILP